MNSITLERLLRDPMSVPVEALVFGGVLLFLIGVAMFLVAILIGSLSYAFFFGPMLDGRSRRRTNRLMTDLAKAHEAWRVAPENYDDNEWGAMLDAIERCRDHVGMPVKEAE
jgi:hypothetical protein